MAGTGRDVVPFSIRQHISRHFTFGRVLSVCRLFWFYKQRKKEKNLLPFFVCLILFPSFCLRSRARADSISLPWPFPFSPAPCPPPTLPPSLWFIIDTPVNLGWLWLDQSALISIAYCCMYTKTLVRALNERRSREEIRQHYPIVYLSTLCAIT